MNNFNYETLEQYYIDIDALKKEQSGLLKQAQEGADSKFHSREGKSVSEEMLWYEVFNLGEDCLAAQTLKPIYPEVFEVSKTLNEKSLELKKYLKETLDVDSEKMTVLDIVKIVKAVK